MFKISVFPMFLFCSGAVKKYPKNRMLGRRQVTDGKVKITSFFYMFYFDCTALHCTVLVLFSETKLLFCLGW
jgi:hypothetical protein